MENKQSHQQTNRIAFYRRRLGYSQRRVARLLGHKSHGALSCYEHGNVFPSLPVALRLEIILRIPVAFLFPDRYEGLRKEIRDKEEQQDGRGQQDLFNKLIPPL
jgi:transcriptional regulator with XRE-family HTH domain